MSNTQTGELNIESSIALTDTFRIRCLVHKQPSLTSSVILHVYVLHRMSKKQTDEFYIISCLEHAEASFKSSVILHKETRFASEV